MLQWLLGRGEPGDGANESSIPAGYRQVLDGLTIGVGKAPITGLLNDVGIAQAMLRGEIVIRNLQDLTPEELFESITPIGLDLRVGREALSPRGMHQLSEAEPRLTIEPDEYITVMTLEDIEVANTIGGLVVSTVSIANRGTSHVSTSLDPGWPGTSSAGSGRLAVQLRNNTDAPFDELRFKRTFCTLVLFRTERPSVKVVRPASAEETNRLIMGQLREKERRAWRTELRAAFLWMFLPLVWAVATSFALTAWVFDQSVEAAGAIASGVGFIGFAAIQIWRWLQER